MLGVLTERLYYHDCYLARFEAQVTAVEDGGQRVYLDRTAFYPSAGGQPHDLGELGGRAVVEVVDEEERVAHVLSAALDLNPGAAVTGEIDWARRYEHMQQHTGQHLLSAVWAELYGFRTLSFHLGPEVVTIELATRELTDQQIESVEERANELASEARVVAIAFEEAEQAAGLRKASGRTGMLRVVDIAGVDRSACGGTHVRSTAETVPIQIRKLERVRGNVRLELVCGGRARRRARQDYRVVAELARQSASSIEKLPEHIASLRQRALDAEKRNQALGLELAARDGRELYASAKAGSDGVRRAKLAVGSLDERTRAVSQAFIEQAGAAVILVRAEQPRGVLIACSRDSGLDAGAILKRVVAAAGGRGGGSATLAQGSLPDGLGNREIEVALEEALGFSLAESGKPEEHGAA